MGIDLYCGKLSYSCSYGYWNIFRQNIIKAAILYLEQLGISSKSEKKKIIFENSDSGEEYDYMFEIYKNILIEFVIERTSYETISLFIELKYLDALIHFGIGGLYSFCNKNDCEGYYSVGNSYDICEMFETIKPFLQDTDDKETLEKVQKIFEESIKIKKAISIT